MKIVPRLKKFWKMIQKKNIIKNKISKKESNINIIRIENVNINQYNSPINDKV